MRQKYLLIFITEDIVFCDSFQNKCELTLKVIKYLGKQIFVSLYHDKINSVRDILGKPIINIYCLSNSTYY